MEAPPCFGGVNMIILCVEDNGHHKFPVYDDWLWKDFYGTKGVVLFRED